MFLQYANYTVVNPVDMRMRLPALGNFSGGLAGGGRMGDWLRAKADGGVHTCCSVYSKDYNTMSTRRFVG